MTYFFVSLDDMTKEALPFYGGRAYGGGQAMPLFGL